jgi:PAS domain S-box-containing protein
MLGRSEEEVVRLGRSGVVVEDAALREWVAARNRDGVAKGVLHYRKADGTVFPVDVTSAVVPGPEGKERAYIIFRDITERVLAEQALRAAHEHLRRAEEFARIGHWEFSIDEKIMHASEGAARVYGTAKTAMPLTDIQGCALPEYRTALDNSLRDLVENGTPYDLEFKIRRASDGAIVDVHSRAEFDANTGRVFGVVQDITKRKKAEEALRESEARFRTLADSAPVGIFQTDARGENVFLNPAAAKITGLSAHEARGTGWTSALHPEDRERVEREWAEGAVAGRDFMSEYRFVLPSGTVTWVRGYGTALRSLSGDLSGYMGVVVDITEHRAMQAKLALASRLAAMGTLVTGVAHEINNPLAAIMASAGTAIEDVAELQSILSAGSSPDPGRLVCRAAEVHEMLGDVTASARRIAGIVKDLAVFGRPDPDRRPTRLGETIQRSLEWLPPFVSERAVIRVEVDEVPEAMASESQITQVIVNLVDNAALAIPDGRRGEVLIRLGRGLPGMVRLEVSDNGRGIAPELMERIFEPFFTTRPLGQGSGLGLSICNAIVTAHGGTITVQSEIGKGSTFSVELPAAVPGQEIAS